MSDEEKELKATFEQDSKRFHRYAIDPGQEITGAIYVPKGTKPPAILRIRLTTKGAMERDGKAGE